MENAKERRKENLFFLAALGGVFSISFINYLLYHSIIEIMSIIVGALIFIIIVNARNWIDNAFLKFLGVAYFFVSILDLIHAFSYQGLNVFSGIDANIPTSLWLMSRYLLSISLLAALLIYKKKIKFSYIVTSYSLLTAFIIAAVFLGFVPKTFVAGQGLTNFKIFSEYIICSFFFGALISLYYHRRHFEERVYRYLNYFIVASILAELVFTLYLSVFDVFNSLGHVFKLVAVFFVYRAVVEEGIQRPHRILYRNLKQNEERLRESEKNLSDLFKNMNSGFASHQIICDENGKAVDYKFLEVNEAFERLTGLKAENIIGQAVTKVIPGIEKDPADWIGKYGKVALEGQSQKLEQYSEDLGKWYSIAAYQPRPGYFAAVFEDISERKEAEKIKSELIYFVSHELKTPLSSIFLGLDLLFRGAAGKIGADQLEYLKSIKESSVKMQDFIEDLLNVARIESNKSFVNVEPMDISIELKTLLSELATSIKEKELKLKLEISKGLPIIMIDGKVFGLILNNLLTNAIRYSFDGGDLCIRSYKKDEELVVEVEDCGRGIPISDQGRVFEKMFRAHNAKQEGISGSGLGLYIAKSMADRIGVKLSFKSAPGEGTTFYVKFPLDIFMAQDFEAL